MRGAHDVLRIFFALVWLVNGLICKLLGLVPRHRQIVGHILGSDHAAFFTQVIGIGEVLMAVWILTGFTPRFNAVSQIAIVLAMNILEALLVPELLLFGRWNALFAVVFCLAIGYNTFSRSRKALITT